MCAMGTSGTETPAPNVGIIISPLDAIFLIAVDVGEAESHACCVQ